MSMVPEGKVLFSEGRILVLVLVSKGKFLVLILVSKEKVLVLVLPWKIVEVLVLVSVLNKKVLILVLKKMSWLYHWIVLDGDKWKSWDIAKWCGIWLNEAG